MGKSTLFGQNVEFLNVKPSGTYSSDYNFKGYINLENWVCYIQTKNLFSTDLPTFHVMHLSWSCQILGNFFLCIHRKVYMVKLTYRPMYKFKFFTVYRSYVWRTANICQCIWTYLQSSVMGLPKVEVNLRRLLCQCESMAKGDLEKDWRLDKVQIFI